MYSLEYFINLSFLLRLQLISGFGDMLKILLLLCFNKLWDKFSSNGFFFEKKNQKTYYIINKYLLYKNSHNNPFSTYLEKYLFLLI